MEVILLKEIKSLGSEGDVVKVKEGYARNYLIPGKLAVRVTPGSEKMIEQLVKKREKKREQERLEAKELAEKIAGLSCTITVKVGEKDQLFGSVTSQDIADVLQKENVVIDKKAILLSEHIKELGVYNIEIRLAPEIKTTLKVWVVKE